jgi:hypothetical protein
MTLRLTLAALGTAVAATLAAGLPASAADERVEIGILRCSVAGDHNFIVGSTRTLSCRFEPSDASPTEFYGGKITRVGLDLGKARTTSIAWAVLAPKTGRRAGALAGSYGGLSAEATAGAGVGANALIGGLERSIALNPVSVQTQTGANLAAGVAGLKLWRR